MNEKEPVKIYRSIAQVMRAAADALDLVEDRFEELARQRVDVMVPVSMLRKSDSAEE